MYAADRLPQFEAFVAVEKDPHANELWREEFDVGYTKGEGWSGGRKKPTPFSFFGESAYNPKLKVSLKKQVFGHFVKVLIAKGYVRFKKDTSELYTPKDDTGSFFDDCFIIKHQKSSKGAKVKYHICILNSRMLQVINKKAILENR